METRETTEVKTPQGHTVVLHTYITGGESRDLRALYLKQAENFPKEVIDEKGLRAAIMESVENQSLKIIIVSFDGKKDGIEGFDLIATLLSLPSSEFKFIVKAINAVVSDGDASEEKKTS